MKLIEGIDYKRNFRSIENLKNRDGHFIKKNTIYRSGSINNLSFDEIDTIKKIKIKTIIDLRKEEKVREEPDTIIEGIKYINIPLYESDKSDIKDYKITNYDTPYIDSYINSVSTKFSINSLKSIFDAIIHSEKPLLIHCSFGRDRTGIVCFLIEKAIGIMENEIYDDYMFSNYSNYLRVADKIKYKKNNFDSYDQFSNFLKKHFVKKDNLIAMEETILKKFISFDNYFNNVLNIKIDELEDNLF